MCQCDPVCQRSPVSGLPSCLHHQCQGTRKAYLKTRSCRSCKLSPTSGYEPRRNDEYWNSMENGVKESHNCFAYAMNTVDPRMLKKCLETESCNVDFPQPGYASGHTPFSNQKEKGCVDMVSRLWGDNPKVRATTFDSVCGKGTSKIALIVDPKRDYHFLRQDPDGYWSHKPGAMTVRRYDASGRPIIRPDRATFMYKNKKEPLTYTQFCGYYCVPRDKPAHMMTKVRQGGASSSSRISTRYRQTRRRPRGAFRE